MTDYKSNSHKSRGNQKASEEASEKKQIEKIASGKVIKKKTGLMSSIMAEDAGDMKTYIIRDIVMPGIKKAIDETVHMFLYGDSGKRSSPVTRYSYNGGNYRDYNKTDSERVYDTVTSRTGYSYNDIVLETRAEGEEVLTRMDEIIDTYGIVSVADFYDLVGVKCSYTDNGYGWTNLRNASVLRLQNGSYVIKLPKALPIK